MLIISFILISFIQTALQHYPSFVYASFSPSILSFFQPLSLSLSLSLSFSLSVLYFLPLIQESVVRIKKRRREAAILDFVLIRYNSQNFLSSPLLFSPIIFLFLSSPLLFSSLLSYSSSALQLLTYYDFLLKIFSITSSPLLYLLSTNPSRKNISGPERGNKLTRSD